MYTWLVELTLGLAGVLSTVTMASPYGATISAQLIRSRKIGGNSLFLSTVNLALRTLIEFEIFQQCHYDGAGAARPVRRPFIAP